MRRSLALSVEFSLYFPSASCIIHLSYPEVPSKMPLDWTPFVELVNCHQRFLLMTHVRPDGDALGSQLALAAALRKRGKTVRTVIASDLPPRYKFLDPNGSKIERFNLPETIFARQMPLSWSILEPGTRLKILGRS